MTRNAANPKAKAVVDAWLQAFSGFASAAGDAGWLKPVREQASAALGDLGLPHRRLEEWRYTSLAALEQAAWRPIAADEPIVAADAAIHTSIDSLALPDEAALRAVFVDGQFAADLSSLEDTHASVHFHRFAEARQGSDGEALLRSHFGRLAEYKTDAFTALNTAFALDGALLEIERGADVDAPIQLVFVSRAGQRLVCPRILVVAREKSRARVIQSYVSVDAEGGMSPSLTNAVVELDLEANATLDWISLQDECDAAIHISNTQVRQARDSRLSTRTLTLGGALIRNELGVLLGDSGAEAELCGLFLGAGHRIADNHTLVDHSVPHCTSRELYKGVLGDASRGVFRGRVVVRPDAQKTDASQSNPNLLLTDRAEIDTKPQLEIYADDVRCSHGSTIGQLDDDALFYLRSRGLSEPDARVLLTRGFANEICDALPGDALVTWGRKHVATALHETFGEAAG